MVLEIRGPESGGTEEIAKKTSRSDVNYKPTDPRRSINPKHEKHEENHTKILHMKLLKSI